jgi:hypothetical protein
LNGKTLFTEKFRNPPRLPLLLPHLRRANTTFTATAIAGDPVITKTNNAAISITSDNCTNNLSSDETPATRFSNKDNDENKDEDMEEFEDDTFDISGLVSLSCFVTIPHISIFLLYIHKRLNFFF